MKFDLEKMIASRTKQLQNLFTPKNFPKVLLLLMVLLILYLFYVNYLKEGFEASSEELESQIKDGKKLVLFYADWCGHCKKVKPDWLAAAEKLNKKDDVKMIMINCGGGSDSDQEIMTKYKVEGYPTIIMFEDGKPTEYTGERTTDDFMKVFS